MKKLKYILLLISTMGLFNSCENYDTDDVYQIKDGPNIAAFESTKINFVALANGDEYDKQIEVKITGPTSVNLSSDIIVTVEAASNSTAISGTHYTIAEPTVTLKKSNNYLGVINVRMLSEGNSPPMEGKPGFEDYVAPVLYVDIATASGETSVVPTGKTASITLNYTPPNPYAGDYDVELTYHHPNEGTYPDNVYGDDPRILVKTLTAITGTKCETGFGVWGNDGEICWITINSDNTIAFVVNDTWNYDVKLGIPEDPSLVSRFDPETRVIYLYYHYSGDGGNRIFHEILTPKF